MDGISWARCSQIFGNLTDIERDCLKRLRVGDFSAHSVGILAHLVKLDLIYPRGGRHELTAEGRIVALFC